MINRKDSEIKTIIIIWKYTFILQLLLLCWQTYVTPNTVVISSLSLDPINSTQIMQLRKGRTNESDINGYFFFSPWKSCLFEHLYMS